MTDESRKTLSIGDRLIGDGQRTFIIAEVANNHNGSIDRAKELIDVALEAGVDVVKFQKRTLEELYTEEFLNTPNKGEHGLHYMVPLLKEFEFTMEEMREISRYCDEKGIMFMLSAWDKPSVDFAESLGVQLHKIGSPDLTNMELIEYTVATGKPLIFSTGMSTEDEVQFTIDYLDSTDIDYGVFHCNSTYPSPVDQLNLKYMNRLREMTKSPVGFSGHELGKLMGAVSVALGATMLERHITLDHTMEGPDHAASLEPDELKEYVQNVRDAEAALGSKKKIFSRGEVLNREVLAKSIAARDMISEGAEITREMVQVIGPGKGLSPQQLDLVVGKKADHDYKKGEFFTEEFLPLPDKLDVPRNWKWGFKGRYETIDELVEKYSPTVFEFHMSDEDAEGNWMPSKDYPVELILHASEYVGRRMVDLCNDDEAQREASRSLIQATIDKAQALAPHFEGTPSVIVHVGGMTVEPKNDEKSIAQMLDYLKQELEMIDKKDVNFYLENLPPRPWYFGGQWTQNIFADGWEIAEFLKETGYDFCFDTSHAMLYCNMANKDLAEYAKVLQPWTKHLHVSDAAGFDQEGLQIGDGEIDFEALFDVLRENPAVIIPEVWRGHLYHNRGHILGMEKLIPYLTND